MSLFPYPNQRFTSRLGLALYGQEEVIAENFLLLDAAYGAGSSINVDGTLVESPNLSSTLPIAPIGDTLVTFQFDSNGNISAYVPTAIAPILPVTKAAIAHEWLNSYTAGTGLFTATQPVVADLGDTPAANTVLAGPTSGPAATATFRALVAADIPTAANLPLWSNLQNAAGNLALANAGYTTTFNQTSAVAWLWANTTVGTVGSTNASPLLELAANYWATGGATGVDLWTVGIAALTAGLNSPSTLTFTHTGSTGTAAVRVPLLDIGGTDAGISRLGAASLAIGNGTAGDYTGSLKLGAISIVGADALYTTKVFQIVNSASAGLFSVTDDGRVYIGPDIGTDYILNVSKVSGDISGRALATFNDNSVTGNPNFQISGSGSFSFFAVPGIQFQSSQAFSLGNGSTYTQEFVKIAAGNFYLQPGRSWGAGGDILTINPATFTSGNFINCNIGGTVAFSVDYTGTAKWSTDTGISRLGAASLAIGNGTAGDKTGILTLKEVILSDFGSAPTSAGTAGTVGEIVQHSGILYFCSVTGPGGGATQWNTITLVPIL